MKSECPFVVGEVYKTRGGRDAEFLAYRPDLRPFERAIFIGNGRLFQRHADGKYCADKESEFDILPPAPKLVERWFAVRKDGDNYCAPRYFEESEQAARTEFPDAHSYHKIEVPE